MPTTGPDLSRLNLTQLRALTGHGERLIRKRLSSLEPVARDGRTVWFSARAALSRIYLGEELDLSRERARLAAAQAERIERQNAIERGEIVQAAEVEAWMVRLFSAIAERIRSLPAKAAPEAHGSETIASCEAVLRKLTDEALEELAGAKWIASPRRANGSAAYEREA